MALWGGRFSKETDQLMREFSSSIQIDGRMWRVDIRASKAHVSMLASQGILSAEDALAIGEGLSRIEVEIESGTWVFDPAAEDIHGEIERRLFELVGEAAKRMHTARSRNDQVATDTRLYLAERVELIEADVADLQTVLVDLAMQHADSLMPGMTHLQHAQPVSLAHHLLAYFWMFERDHERLSESRPRILSLPLGSAALAGTGFAIDRRKIARDLGFLSVAPNSLDAVSDRDFVLEFLAQAAICMMHLSRLCEDLILWSTPEFGFVELADEVTTGSSIMPQKKNPDCAELIRGRAGRVYGALIGGLTMMKALPLSYNRDMQEDKVHLFTSIDTLSASLRLMALMLRGAEWKVDRMSARGAGDFSNATDLADDLAAKGVSFRAAHEVVGELVRDCLRRGVALEQLNVDDLRKHHPLFDESSVRKVDPRAVMNARTSEGGTAKPAVLRQLELAQERLIGRCQSL